MRSERSQAAIDFLMSYGIALIIIAIAVAVIAKVTIQSPTLATSTCTPAPGFSCKSFFISRTGVLSLTLAQATGGTIDVMGVACATLQNTTGNKPAYGNVGVNSLATYYAGNYIPDGGTQIYSGSDYGFKVYCYARSGVDRGVLGNSFIGYVWLNYTIPSGIAVTQQVATLNMRYT